MTIDLFYWVMVLEFVLVVVYLCNIKATVDRIEAKLETEQEPDEVISRTGEEGVFLQPTGSHETDPFIKR